jgi:hypothetical protein
VRGHVRTARVLVFVMRDAHGTSAMKADPVRRDCVNEPNAKAIHLLPAQIYSKCVTWARADGYMITDDRDSLDLAVIHRWLSEESYWAQGRTIEVVARSIERSVALGCFSPLGAQVGFARWVTDEATFG